MKEEKSVKEMIINDLVTRLTDEEKMKYLRIGLSNAYNSNQLYNMLTKKINNKKQLEEE